jgi:hypothetical protein
MNDTPERKRRWPLGIGCLAAPALVIGLAQVEQWLLKHGILNTIDFPPVGDNTGTMYEYLTNIWYWDAALMCLLLLSILTAAQGVTILAIEFFGAIFPNRTIRAS